MKVETLDLAGLFIHQLAFSDLTCVVISVASGD